MGTLIDAFGRALNPGTFAVLFALIFIGLLVSAVVLLILVVTRSGTPATRIRLFVLMLALALFGSIAGYSGGLSRSAAVGDIIPAVLGLAGGLAVYLFGIDTSRGAVASISLSAFAVGLFLGYSFGASIRSDIDRNVALRDACIGLYFHPDIYASSDVFERTFGADNARYNAICRDYILH
jgi:hypothetical protein